MIYTNLIKTSELLSNLHNPDWVIVDCRFDLTNPEWGFLDYQREHIPGSVYAHLNDNLAGPTSSQTGRHPLPDWEKFSKNLSEWGINNSKQVVVYDTTNGSFASRLWWMLRSVKHETVAVLDGGFVKWKSDNYSTRSGVENNRPTTFRLPQRLPSDKFVNTQEVEQIRANPDYVLIDARSLERFLGEKETIDPVAGHIPGAINRFHELNLQADGTLKSKSVLKAEFENLLKGIDPKNIVVYCGSGVTSCHHLLALDVAGLKGARLYVGSWSEWIRDPKRPRAPTN
ncbi:MAG TPA: sulfurtransferase [Anaerolineaceae bacterium]|nr:sulfurtransferase [Anaerolineaceae bacterium]